MATYRTRECECVVPEVYGGHRKPDRCEHNNRYERVQPDGSVGAKQSRQPDRDWTAARAKVESEARCRACDSRANVEAAHVIGRKHDEPVHPGSRTRYVDPNRIVPLCSGCHGEYDAKRLDILKHLRPEEQTQAVADAGGIERARRRLLPSAYKLESPVGEAVA